MMRRMAMVWALALFTASGVCGAQEAESGLPGFTAEQARAGRDAYRQSCAQCHGQQLEGRDIAPGLRGDRFDQMWRGTGLDVLMFHLHRMPQQPAGEPGSLSEETYTNILAYLLLSNGVEAGDAALPSDKDALSKLKLPRLEGQTYDPDAPTIASPADSALLTGLSPVTDELLKNPPENDWLQWGRTYDGTNYSPLDVITPENARDITSVWHATLRNGSSMPTPLVHDGVMFLQTFPDTTLALDGATGKVLWRYQYKPKYGSSQKLGLAIHGENVYVPTSDLHVIALNAKTGALVWDHEIALGDMETMRGRYNLRSAPLVVGDKVIQGVTASFVPRGGFIVAIDSATGEQSWRFDTIARPGEAFGDSWNGLPLEKRSGGSVWHLGTYDPELNLVYYGVAPTYDTGPLLHPIDDDSVNSDALYTNCTIALNPDTGELVWHYQHMANDQWDLDWVFERQIVTMPVDGEPRKVVMNAGKMAIVDALDAETGKYLFSIDPGVQNVVKAIDPITGHKTYDLEKMPDPERPCVICPTADGARTWQSTTYSARTNLLYMPILEWCMTMGKEGIKLLSSGVGLDPSMHPDAMSDGMIARLQAIDVAGRKLGWVRDFNAPMTTSALATAGGVIFVGDMEPSLKAIDDTTGELLWQAPLDDMPSCNLITYKILDKQYVAVIVGFTNNHIRDLGMSYAEFHRDRGEPEPTPPKGGAGIWVFAR